MSFRRTNSIFNGLGAETPESPPPKQEVTPRGTSIWPLRLHAALGGLATHWFHLCIGLYLVDATSRPHARLLIPAFFVSLNCCRGIARERRGTDFCRRSRNDFSMS